MRGWFFYVHSEELHQFVMQFWPISLKHTTTERNTTTATTTIEQSINFGSRNCNNAHKV
jgi:hypothetical protein